MKFINKLECLLSENAEEFASIFGYPRISPWIIQQYNKGYTSKTDYDIIVNWVINNNPNLNDFSFDAALKRAKEYAANAREGEFDPYMELHSSTISLDFENGRKWLDVGPEDCNALCHRLQFDYSDELRGVHAGNGKCWALQDPQDNTLCALIDTEPHPTLIGQFGKAPTGYHQEIKGLCIRKGLNLSPEAYDNTELAKAINNGELNLDEVSDLRGLIGKLSTLDIISGNLLKYAHLASPSTMLDLYKRTQHQCLLKYLVNYLIANNMTDLSVYQNALALVKRDPEIVAYFNGLKSNDNRIFGQELEKNLAEIQAL